MINVRVPYTRHNNGGVSLRVQSATIHHAIPASKTVRFDFVCGDHIAFSYAIRVERDLQAVQSIFELPERFEAYEALLDFVKDI